ncbi:MAG: tRNA (adenosine(37)-N6)-dimethylallyltransferase MiaA [Clostridiales bacterium]|jgi:tRNA dimethylallyltransferase|nr:tRNA (adenosine(37)-N6)-dimethylallyltransferase MiaA [Clostridiales bacterium]
MTFGKEKIIAVVGPTASGKTRIAAALASDFNGEVISADSMQIYKGLNVGTAKPRAEETLDIKHHLIDFVEPSQSYSAALYQRDARAAVERLFANGQVPVIAGGTGLFINAVLYDMSFSKTGKNDGLRADLERRYAEIGGEAMLAELSAIDGESAKKLHANDKKRVVRYFESALSGEKPDADEFNLKLFYKNHLIIGLNPERSKLYEKINERTDAMIENGLIDEVRDLIKGGLTFDAQSMQSIGYKEFKDFFDSYGNIGVTARIIRPSAKYGKFQDLADGGAGKSSAVTQGMPSSDYGKFIAFCDGVKDGKSDADYAGNIDDIRVVTELIKRHTRNYAKRQITWFKRYKHAVWFDSYDENAYAAIKSLAAAFLAAD